MEVPAKLRPYTEHGITFTGKSGDTHLVADCPFCDKEKHFFVRMNNGQYKCHVCGEAGNVITFLDASVEFYKEQTTSEDWRALSAARQGIPAIAFKRWDLGWSGEYWMIPQRSKSGTVRNVGRWAGPKRPILSTSGCQKQLFGTDKLIKASKKLPVWICAGEWDAMVLEWLLRKLKRKDTVCAVPGELTFKEDWLELFDGRDVRLVYDADATGDKGAMKASLLLKQRGQTRSVQFVRWPMDLPKGFDVSDWIAHGWKDHRDDLDGVLSNLEKLLGTQHRLGANAAAACGFEDQDGEEDTDTQPDEIPSWEELHECFAEYLMMDEDMTTALVLCLAVVLSRDIAKDPLWLHLVAPPGGGKTTILNTFRNSKSCVFRSSLTPASLVSGFRCGHDPSLLPKLRGKCGIFKDGTELLAMHESAKQETNAIFRGAYDGDVDRTYGNAVERIYRNLNFTLIIGMTPAVHGESDATVGERFLKLQMVRSEDDRTDRQLWMALENIGREQKIDETLQEKVAAFLWNRIDLDNVPTIPRTYKQRIIALAQLISMLRARVERDKYRGNVRYRPHYEVATRLTKGLAKVGICVAHVLGKSKVDDEVWQYVERVAFDTAIGFHLDIVQAVMKHDGVATGATIADECGLPITSLTQKFEDLRLLGVFEKKRKAMDVNGRGRPPSAHVISKRVQDLWKQAHVVADHTKRAAKVRRRRTKWETEGRKRPRAKVRKKR
jgi:hypothetical protein